MDFMTGISVFAPATIGNLSVGFDALGLAIAPQDGTLLGDTVSLSAGERDDWNLQVTGRYSAELPENPEDNVVLACCRRFAAAAAEREVMVRPLEVVLEKRLPIGTGLGSSACSVVATLEALNRFHRHPFTTAEIFALMAEMEGGISGGVHTDNIGPCLFGGLRLCPPGSSATYALPWPAPWRVVVCWPGTRVETKKARQALPAEVPLHTAVEQGSHFATFVHALHAGDTRLAAASLVDLLAEPHRKALLPGFDKSRRALAGLGALAVGISGSGPSIFAVVDDFEVANAVEVWMKNNYRSEERGFVHVCGAELGGARSISPTKS